MFTVEYLILCVLKAYQWVRQINNSQPVQTKVNLSKANKDLNPKNFQTNETKDSETSAGRFQIASNFMKLALNEVQKSARGEECSTERRSNRSSVLACTPPTPVGGWGYMLKMFAPTLNPTWTKKMFLKYFTQNVFT